MAALILSAALAASVPAQPQTGVARWAPLIERASARFGVPAEWVRQVMHAESDGATVLDGMPIRSRAGAMGLMQLMPGTWKDMRTAYGLGANPDDPADNILAGTAYLRLLYDRFGYPGLFGAYNAGPTRYAEYLARMSSLSGETRAYLMNVSGGHRVADGAMSTRRPVALFALRHDRGQDPTPTTSGSEPASLFALMAAPR